MKNPMMSFWLSSANQAASWWMGHAANAMRTQQRMILDEMTKASTGEKPKRKRRTRKRRTSVRQR